MHPSTMSPNRCLPSPRSIHPQGARVFCLALAVFLTPCPASAATVPDLLEQGDRLTQTDDGFPDSFTRALTRNVMSFLTRRR